MNFKLKSIESLPFIEANNIINELCNDRIKFSKDDIEFVLNLNEKELIGTFFSEYSLFEYEDFLYIEKFINSNLDNSNLDFLSDLIYFATDFGLDINYKKILEFLLIDEIDNDFLVLACLQYLNANIKFIYVETIVKNLEVIRNNTIYHQNEQLLASLILFRITHQTNYLDFIIELVNYDATNLEFLNNTLKDKSYDSTYFNLPKILKNILSDNANLL
ncbi:hypothetical protein LNQ49_16740 [Flavobacterium sp. F-65]|uniref:Uncharacterized protein n=1 Tax=Flavobacterium pisciphilum TaxID=2893755 RepID=A0ABS8MYJ2_9FLAO|nr:hypothetical protein [Flavobacterium sp. F-65]MCC9073226.1 hypothetical protein [Flavobacterium sp. F-65]